MTTQDRPALPRPIPKRAWFKVVVGIGLAWNLTLALFLAAVVAAIMAPLSSDESVAAAPMTTSPSNSALPSPTPEPPSPTPTRTTSTSSPTPTATPKPPPTRSPASSPSPTTPSSKPKNTAKPGTALAAAQSLTVKGRAPRTGYGRGEFGQRWADIDRNGCDQRNDVLRRDLTGFKTKAGSNGCSVVTGTLHDPYTDKMIKFKRGSSTSSAIQVDHVVALSDGWQKGAQLWTVDKRQQFANDFLNLAAVDGPTNAAKGDGDTATWLPPNRAHRCTYVARQVAVKMTYGLWVTQAEGDAMERVLATCPDLTLPTDSDVPAPDRSTEVRSEVRAPAKPSSTAPKPRSSRTYYKNCSAVRNAGAAPIRRGEPGYAKHLDRDGDGVGCESGGNSGGRSDGNSARSEDDVHDPADEGGSANTYYQNCSAVRDAGADPIRRGDPGYGSHLDRDGDGIGCE